MKNKIRVSKGIVFAIPLDSDYFAYGQIVSETKPKCYIIYDYVSIEHPEVMDIVNKKVIMLTYTVDNFIEDGDWIVIGKTEQDNDIQFPNYLIETLEGSSVMDYTGKIIRKATDEDKAFLVTKKSVSPKVLDNAVKAKFGRGEWYPVMDILNYK